MRALENLTQSLVFIEHQQFPFKELLKFWVAEEGTWRVWGPAALAVVQVEQEEDTGVFQRKSLL